MPTMRVWSTIFNGIDGHGRRVKKRFRRFSLLSLPLSLIGFSGQRDTSCQIRFLCPYPVGNSEIAETTNNLFIKFIS